MHIVGGHQRQTRLPRQLDALVEHAIVVRPAMKLRQQIAAIGEHFAVSQQFFGCRVAHNEADQSFGMTGNIVERQAGIRLWERSAGRR